MSDVHWSALQTAIFDYIATKRNPLVVQAYAGCGKTTTIIEMLNHIPPHAKIYLGAFNTTINKELQARVAKVPFAQRVKVQTLHGRGYATLAQTWRGVGSFHVNEDDRERSLGEGILRPRLSYEERAEVFKLLGMAKKYVVEDARDLHRLMSEFECHPSSNLDPVFYVEWVQAMLKKSREPSPVISFDDMVYVPAALKLRTGYFDYVIVDECVPGDTPILLADGSSKPIREIVEQQLPVEVRSFDEAQGTTVKPVVGWHRVPLTKDVVRLTVRQIGYGLDGTRLGPLTERVRFGTRHLVCTRDHRIYTQRGWIPAGDLQPGDRTQIETAAPRDKTYNHTYKHGLKGKATLRAGLASRVAQFPTPSGNPQGPPQRGGNGHGLTEPQAILLEALGPDWEPEHIVRTGYRKGEGRPTSYRIDLAHTGCQIAIEIDGASHRTVARRESDQRKDEFLRSRGWTVVRVSNLDAIRKTQEIIDALPPRCPVDAEIISVDPYALDDAFVYDLTIADTHCYYAHGVLVHNCQDMNQAQLRVAQQALKPNGTMVLVGDRFQAIYGWNGADPNAMPQLVKSLRANELPLSVTYRCPRAIVAHANRYVPELRAAPEAPEGRVEHTDVDTMKERWRPGDFVISRTNAALVTLALWAMNHGVAVDLRGRDLGQSLGKLITDSGEPTIQGFLAWLSDKTVQDAAKLEAAGKLRQIDALYDKQDALVSLCTGCGTLTEVQTRIKDVFGRVQAGAAVILTTVHKAKGLEAPRVWLLSGTFRPDRSQEEANLYYVAVTRAQQTLLLVHEKPRTQSDT